MFCIIIPTKDYWWFFLNKDRLFIKKYDNFIYAIRNIVYFGNAKKSSGIPDPKHDRLRFINYFGSEINEQYYFFLLCLRPSPVLPVRLDMMFEKRTP